MLSVPCGPCAQVLAPMQGALPQQTGVIIQPQQLVLASGNKVQGNQQVLDKGINIILMEIGINII